MGKYYKAYVSTKTDDFILAAFTLITTQDLSFTCHLCASVMLGWGWGETENVRRQVEASVKETHFIIEIG